MKRSFTRAMPWHRYVRKHNNDQVVLGRRSYFNQSTIIACVVTQFQANRFSVWVFHREVATFFNEDAATEFTDEYLKQAGVKILDPKVFALG